MTKGGKRGRKPLVLVAYPVANENQRDLFVIDLRLVGYATHLVREAEHLRQSLKKRCYDAVVIGRALIDPMCQDCDGYVIAMRIKKQYPHLRVLLMDPSFHGEEDCMTATGVQFVPDSAHRLEITLMHIFYPERAEALCVCADRPIIPGKP